MNELRSDTLPVLCVLSLREPMLVLLAPIDDGDNGLGKEIQSRQERRSYRNIVMDRATDSLLAAKPLSYPQAESGNALPLPGTHTCGIVRGRRGWGNEQIGNRVSEVMQLDTDEGGHATALLAAES